MRPDTGSPSAFRGAVSYQKYTERSLSILIALWILEGALRKWITPLDTPLYFLRDALTAIIIFTSWAVWGRRPWSRQMRAALWIVATSVILIGFIQLLTDRIDVAVGLIGLRNYIAPIGCLFIAASIYDPTAFGRLRAIILAFLPIQLLLIVFQVSSAPSAFVNVAPGGEDAVLTTANSIVRASGTFSAPAGLVGYLVLCVALVLPLFGDPRIGRARAVVAVLILASAVALNGSRGAVFLSAVLVVALIFRTTSTRPGRGLTQTGALVFVCLGGYIAANQFLPAVVEAFAERFVTASQSEDTFGRIFGIVFGYLSTPFSVVGEGLGSRSISGIAVGSPGPWIEDDSKRWVVELGLVGYALAIMRSIAGLIVFFRLFSGGLHTNQASFLIAVLVAVTLVAGTITTTPSSQALFSITMSLLILSQKQVQNAPRHEEKKLKSY